MQQAVARRDGQPDTDRGNPAAAPRAPEPPEALSQDQVADLIVRLYRDNAPPRASDADDASVTSVMWALLDSIDKSPQDTKASMVLKLSQTTWFADFLTNSMIRKHSKDRQDAQLTFGEMVRFLQESCRAEPPGDYARSFCMRESGMMVFFEPKKALDSLARNWNAPAGPSTSVKKRFLQLEWAGAWLEANQLSFTCKSQHTLARLVNKDAKIELLRIFHSKDLPAWNDKHAIRVGSEKDMVWQFRPLQWLDDISNQWLGGKRRSMKLTTEEMRTLEQFPWFKAWMKGLSEKRKNRREKKLTRAVPEPLPGEPCEECDYTESVNAICGCDEEEDTPRTWPGDPLGFAVGAESQEL